MPSSCCPLWSWGAKYGSLSGAVGLTLADLLAGYTTWLRLLSWPNFLGLVHRLGRPASVPSGPADRGQNPSAGRSHCLHRGFHQNVITEPLIRYSFKVSILGLPQQVAYVGAVNCAVSMAVSNVVSVVLAVVLYRVMEKSIGL